LQYWSNLPRKGTATMAKSTYSRGDFGTEVQAVWGYYQPMEAAVLEFAGKLLLYTLGSACIEASCCGKGSWNYVRVEGYVAKGGPEWTLGGSEPVEIDTIEDTQEQAAIAKLLAEKHPGVRVEFR
jgi:hypothetical protein